MHLIKTRFFSITMEATASLKGEGVRRGGEDARRDASRPERGRGEAIFFLETDAFLDDLFG